MPALHHFSLVLSSWSLCPLFLENVSNFFSFSLLPVVAFYNLKQAHRGKRYTTFEYVLTPRLHKAWFPRGKWAFGMFTFCSHFWVASKTLPLRSPQHHAANEMFAVGEQMLTWLLQVKRKEKACADKQELPWDATETPIHPLQFAGHAMCVLDFGDFYS